MLLYEFSSKEKNKKQKNYGNAIASLGLAGYVGQQTVRSGVPRLLGVRLESHSTSNKNAKDILRGGGWLDPDLSGTKSISPLKNRVDQGLDDMASRAANKVYITGLHKDAPVNNMNPIARLLHRQNQRKLYRAQGEIDWDKLSKDAENNPLVKEARQKWEDSLTNEKFYPVDRKILKTEYVGIRGGVQSKARKLQTLKNIFIPGKGRSLYIGGTDDFFNSNFKPDFDDLTAMYSDKKVKVFGNRASATIDALKKGGLKNILSNPKRNLAGAAILLGGGLLTKKLVDEGIKELSDGRVEAHRRKGKDGRMFAVRAFQRKLHNK